MNVDTVIYPLSFYLYWFGEMCSILLLKQSLSLLGIIPRASRMLNQCSTIELHTSQPEFKASSVKLKADTADFLWQ